jgi:D-lactate dehydrogenase
MRAAFFSTQPYDRTYFEHATDRHQFIFLETALHEQSVALAAGCDAVCVFVNDQVSAKVIEQLHALGVRLILLRCAGFNNVDLAAAKAAGICVARVPAYSPNAVAEHALALIMALNRKTHKAYNRVREGNFSLDRLTGFDLFGKTVGVVGTGKIGAVFCRIMLGIGCKVLAFDLVEDTALSAAGVHYLPLIDMLAQSDIVSLHCPLNEQTRHIIGGQTLPHMKRGVMLINTGRGGLIDTGLLIGALKSGQIGYLGLDVYEQEEKLFFADRSETVIQDDLILRLIGFPNVLITAHQGFFTVEALQQIVETTIRNIDEFAQQGTCANRV